MRVLRWGIQGGLALMLAGSAVWAGDTDDLNAMKATMDNMKQEMEAMRSTMASERDALRANAGGAPEALKSANGKATVKIGGDFRVRYNVSYENGYSSSNAATNIDNGNTRYTRTSWDIYKAELNFKIDFTPDTYGFFALRPDRGSQNVASLLDKAFWNWSNIGGTGFAARVGLQQLPIGLYNCPESPWQRVLIWDPLVRLRNQSPSTGAGGASDANYTYNSSLAHATDTEAIGARLDYKLDQFNVAAGVYGERVAPDAGVDNTLGVTTNGTARNLDVQNHFLTLTYDPCWMEGLKFQGTYFGEFDQGAGVSSATWYPSDYTTLTTTNHGATYTPGVIIGGVYTQEKWAVYTEAQEIVNPNYYQDSNEFTWSNGADYALTEKLKIGGAIEWRQIYASRFWGNVNSTGDSTLESYTIRGSLGAKYDFGNGLFVQAQYLHYITQTWGVNDSNAKDSDLVTLQTGFKF